MAKRRPPAAVAPVAEEGPGPESRSSTRQPYVQFLWFHGLADETSGIGQSVDVSEQGIGFVSSHMLTIGEKVFLVVLSPSVRISAIGTVVHARELGPNSFRIGVKLDILPPTDRAAWAHLVSGAP